MPAIAPISSMRLLVVGLAPPNSSFSCAPARKIAPQPPGPGLPLHAPSVKISTSLISIESISAGARDAAVEAQLLAIFERVFRLHQRAGRVVEPVVEPRQQEAKRAAAR